MFRSLTLPVIVLVSAFAASADQPKKVPAVDLDTLAKDCASSLLQAMKDGKGDEVVKLLDAPFRSPENKKLETLEGFKEAFSRKQPDAIDSKVIEVVSFDQFNAWLVKNMAKEFDEVLLKEYREYLGPKDGRIVIVETTINGTAPKTIRPSHFLVRIKAGKAHVVGMNNGR